MTAATMKKNIKACKNDLNDDFSVVLRINSYLYDVIEDFKAVADPDNSTGAETILRDEYQEEREYSDDLILDASNYLSAEINRIERKVVDDKARKKSKGGK